MTEKKLQSDCGCCWERTEEYGDVIVIQCAKHARLVRSPESRKAMTLADAYVAKLRKEGKIK